MSILMHKLIREIRLLIVEPSNFRFITVVILIVMFVFFIKN